MKFFAEPKHFVRIINKNSQRILGMKGFYFDDKGEFVTDNPRLINALKPHFKFEEEKSEVKITSDDIVVDSEKTVKKKKGG